MYCKVYSLAVCLCREIKISSSGATTFPAMKTKLKHIFFLATLSFTAMACGGSAAKPLSGLDVSLLPVGLLTVSPQQSDDEETEPATLKIDPEAKDNAAGTARTAKRSSPRNTRDQQQHSTISNQQ